MKFAAKDSHYRKRQMQFDQHKTLVGILTHIILRQFSQAAFFNFSNAATIDYFNSIGFHRVEQGDRVFPLHACSGCAQSAFARMQELGVDLLCSSQVLNVSTVMSFPLFAAGGILSRRSYRDGEIFGSGTDYCYRRPLLPGYGSTGDGYDFARSLEHSVTEIFPSLTALMPRMYDTDLVGIELRNVGLSLFIDLDLIKMEDGELTFTSNGIEGALGFRLSRRAVWALIKGQRVELVLDLKPALSLEKLRARIARDLTQMGTTADKIGRNQFRTLFED